MADDDTLEAAIKWLGRAELLGFYSGNVARLIRAGAEAVSRVLSEDEDRSAGHILENLDSLYGRLMNREGKLNADTVRTYVSRTRRLLKDYQNFLADPKSFKPTSRRGRGPAKMKKEPVAEPMALFPEPVVGTVPTLSAVATPPSEQGVYRDHILHLSTGKAMLRIPSSISADDVALLTLVIRSHGPAAPPVVS